MDLDDRSQSPCDIKYKKRGRPTGRNRVPLSLEERRARNALYERERRHATSEAMSLLAEAAGCDPTMSNADILATAVSQLQQVTHTIPTDDIAELKRFNKKLIHQVETLEQRLSNWEETENNKEVAEDSNYISGGKRKNSSTKKIKNHKKAKIESPTNLFHPTFASGVSMKSFQTFFGRLGIHGAGQSCWYKTGTSICDLTMDISYINCITHVLKQRL